MRGILPRKIMGNGTDVEFEGNTFKGVTEWDTYLTKIYGDYMTIPPGPKQKQHNFHFLNMEQPYRDFKESQLSE